MKNRICFILCLGLLGTLACHKIPNTTPRYNPEQCPLCNLNPGKCTYCAATGTCNFCDGTGKRWEGVGEKRYQTSCVFCQGKGKCSYCGGSGACFLCGGDGTWKYPGTGVPPVTPPRVQ